MIDHQALAAAKEKQPGKISAAMTWLDHTNDREVMQKGSCRDPQITREASKEAKRKLDFTNISRNKDAYEPEIKVCKRCPIRTECLTRAFDNLYSFGEVVGVYGAQKATDIMDGLVPVPGVIQPLIDNDVIIRNHNLEL